MEHELIDIYTMCHVPFWQTAWFFGVTMVAGLLVVLCVLRMLIKKLRGRTRTLTPWEHAIQQLNALRLKDRMMVVHGKEFYHTLTRIMKEYVYERYHIDAVSATDQEFLSLLEQKAVFTPALQEQVQEVLDGLSFIKFANAQAGEKKMEEDFARVMNIVTQTIPVKP